MEAIGEATDLDEALRQVRRSDADVLILDLAACENGPGLIARLRNECPWTRVLVLTALDTPDHVLAVLAAGAKGYVLGTAPAHDVLKAIRAVSRGSTYVKVTPEMCPPTPA
jgi:DNA-binding NarL/FixJ family response regulator